LTQNDVLNSVYESTFSRYSNFYTGFPIQNFKLRSFKNANKAWTTQLHINNVCVGGECVWTCVPLCACVRARAR